MKVILYMAMTANGLIAKKDDSAEFVTQLESEAYAAAVCSAGVVIVGRKTYEVLSVQPEFQNFVQNKVKIIVVSRTNFKLTDSNHAVAHSPKEALSLVGDFDKVIVAGGGMLNASFMEEDLVDEIYLDIEPAFLGKGIPLFNGGEFETQLKFLESKVFGEGEIQLHYTVVKV